MLYVLHITVLCMQHVRGLLALCCSINSIQFNIIYLRRPTIINENSQLTWQNKRR